MKEIESFTSGRFSKIPIICGPTASGKSSLALSLCQKIHGELCSCDSMQIYRHMDIGTAKPTQQEQRIVRHHLIDLVEPSEPFSVASYVGNALLCIEDCLNRSVLPVFCGGTGQYASALALGIHYADISIDPSIHDALVLEGTLHGYEVLFDELLVVDPISAAKIHPNNKKRVIRALEIYRQTGETMTHFNEKSLEAGPEYPYALFAIEWDRETLYKRMDKRVDQMIASGLLDEVRNLIKMGLSSENTSMQAIGYKEFQHYLENRISYESAVLEIKQKTRNYAKRQFTWFRNMSGIFWIQPGDEDAVLREIEKK